MNYGYRETISKQKNLVSTGQRLSKKSLVVFFKILLYILLLICITGCALVFGIVRGIIDAAPDIQDVSIVPSSYSTTVYNNKEKEIAKLVTSGSNRIKVSIDQVPDNLKWAFIDTEDARFYEHNGIDPSGIIRAFVVGVSHGFHFTEGASTITQQLLKNNVFTDWMEETRMQSFKRKIQEQYLALKLEKTLTAEGENAKDVILENYLNTINLGSGCYGVQTAAQTYFGKDAKDLTLSECAVLAAIPKAPTAYNPKNHPEKNQQRRDKILNNMKEQGYITEEEYTIAMNDNVYDRIAMHTQSQAESAPYSYFIDEVITNLINDLMVQKGYTEVQAKNVVYSGGLKIYTTQDSYMQSILDTEFQNPENFPANTQIGLDWALTVEQADGEVQNYSKEMLQLYVSTWYMAKGFLGILPL